jgi:hypothetical protein
LGTIQNKLFFLLINKMPPKTKVRAPHLYIYRQMTNGGFAPHVSKAGILTLTICKPAIRRTAEVGDYVMALAGKSLTKVVGKGADSGLKMSYLFKITEKIPMAGYKSWCTEHAPNKIPSEPNFMGNCQYNSNLEYMPGPHGPHEKEHDLGGCYSIASRQFGAWTFENLHTLTEAEIATLGISKNEISDVGRAGRKIPISAEQGAALDALILGAPKKGGLRRTLGRRRRSIKK